MIRDSRGFFRVVLWWFMSKVASNDAPWRSDACICEGIIIIKLLDPTHRAESRFTALLTRMNDYVADPNSDVRYRIIQLATYVPSNSITSRSTWSDMSFVCTTNPPIIVDSPFSLAPRSFKIARHFKRFDTLLVDQVLITTRFARAAMEGQIKRDSISFLLSVALCPSNSSLNSGYLCS